jgi:hypothetical protein
MQNMLEKNYRNIFLVQNRAYWKTCPFPYDPGLDLVLTFDFAVLTEIKSYGGNGAYLDHLVDSETMERYNHDTYDFFAQWHRDADKRDLFVYKGIPFGNAFRMEIWNDITYNVRIFLNLLEIKKTNSERIYAGIEDECVLCYLKLLSIKHYTWCLQNSLQYQEYYFPVFRWMMEKIHPSGAKQFLKTIIWRTLDILFQACDCILSSYTRTNCIFVHRYYPTLKIIDFLKMKKDFRLILETYSKNFSFFKERRLPVDRLWIPGYYRDSAKKIMSSFLERKTAQWRIGDFDLASSLYQVILSRIVQSLPSYLFTIETIMRQFARKKLILMITTTNIGMTNCLILNYCHKNKIPSYLIINGLLWGSYLDEGKDATWINSYGNSIKQNYFKEMTNVVCLGDPRMDAYATVTKNRINYVNPTIVIGAGGFSNINLNSYVAFEFDFLNDIMNVCRDFMRAGKAFKLCIKVRANGYIDQYAAFLKEYYPDLSVTFCDKVSMKDLLINTDLYISIYSQTLFEASCLGIPALYYKKDTEENDPPFDGKSELVTAMSVSDLKEKMNLFFQRSSLYDSFREKSVMEKYIGSLDGCNLKRNIDFIYSLFTDSEQSGLR